MDQASKPPSILLYVGLDEMTGFPCLRFDGEAWFSLLPVTKLQVALGVSDKALWPLGHPDRVEDAVRRVNTLAGFDRDPPEIERTKQIPIRALKSSNVVSVVATHLKMWSNNDEVEGAQRVRFPTAMSEWGILLRWLGTHAPDANTARSWRTRLMHCSSPNLIFDTLDVLRTGGLTERVDELLTRVAKLLPEQAQGLPFAEGGVWELVSDARRISRLWQGGPPVPVFRPIILGPTEVWPVIATDKEDRMIYWPALPMVGVRPMMTKVEPAGTLWIEPQPPQSGARAISPDDPPRRAIQRPKNYHRKTGTMNRRCYVCYGEIPKAVWELERSIWCIHVRQEGSDQLVYHHTNDNPRNLSSRDLRVIRAHLLSNDYLHVARQDRTQVRIVTVVGSTQHGKTCYLLSLNGILLHPIGADRFTSMFLESLGFRHDAPILLSDRDALRRYEGIYLDGTLPRPDQPDAPRSPSAFVFEAKAKPILPFGGQRIRRIPLVGVDMPGELTGRHIAQDDRLRHIPYTTDVLYLVDAKELDQCYLTFCQFIDGLRTGSSDSPDIDLKRVNLILAITKIDTLLNGSDAERKLLKICTRGAFLMPQRRDWDELRAYWDGMQAVNRDIAAYLSKHCRDLVRDADIDADTAAVLDFPREFRQVVESRQIDSIWGWLLDRKGALACYLRGTDAVSYRNFRREVWHQPDRRLPEALRTLNDAQSRHALDDLLADVMKHVLEPQHRYRLRHVFDAGVARTFYRVCYQKQGFNQLMELDRDLVGFPGYADELGRYITRRALESATPAQWARYRAWDRQRKPIDPLSRAARRSSQETLDGFTESASMREGDFEIFAQWTLARTIARREPTADWAQAADAAGPRACILAIAASTLASTPDQDAADQLTRYIWSHWKLSEPEQAKLVGALKLSPFALPLAEWLRSSSCELTGQARDVLDRLVKSHEGLVARLRRRIYGP